MADMLSDLLALGNEVLSSEGDADMQISKVEEYSSLFDKWYESHQKDQTFSPEEKHKLTELSQLHAEVLEVASRLKGDTFAKIQELKRKGKGIVAYVKNMPGGDSRSRPVRKG